MSQTLWQICCFRVDAPLLELFLVVGHAVDQLAETGGEWSQSNHNLPVPITHPDRLL